VIIYGAARLLCVHLRFLPRLLFSSSLRLYLRTIHHQHLPLPLHGNIFYRLSPFAALYALIGC